MTVEQVLVSQMLYKAGRVKMDSIDKIIGYHCAPAIRGIKISNLVSIPGDMDAQLQIVLTKYNRDFNNKGLFFFELCSCKERKLLFVFRKKQLENYLRRPSHREFLHTYGYDTTDTLEVLLAHLKERMEASIEFPHEIGIFLGYPLDDVQSFISSQGRGYKICGEWKVYYHEESAKHSFFCFKTCREYCHKQLNRGKTFSSLVAQTA